MTRLEPIQDPDGDRIFEQERRDREVEKQSHPQTWLGPLDFCRECGSPRREVRPSHWACQCEQRSVAA